MDIFAFLVPAQPSGFVVGASETESRKLLTMHGGSDERYLCCC